MNLYFRCMKFIRKLLFPFSLLYGIVTALRNFYYDAGILKSQGYEVPIISVGNLSTGGTGKSPMIEFLISFLTEEYTIAVLSRGYKRKTKGFQEVFVNSIVEDVGDEPLQFKKKFPQIKVVVCEDRREGISKLLSSAEVILLDDAFQHRKVKAQISILLTTFNNLYYNDRMLPTGNLREYASGAKRADFIVVTKCPEKVSYAKLQEIEYRIQLKSHQKLYFSRIGYDSNIFGISETLSLSYLNDKFFSLVTGIADAKPLLNFLNGKGFSFEHLHFSDHHHFSDAEIEIFKQKEIILTTEKDFVRIQPKLQKFALYYLPIKTEILNQQEHFFKESIFKNINSSFS
ncbi:MAG: tetraacyldisaccharide 4'-kinase [Flavobacteriales bacterium]